MLTRISTFDRAATKAWIRQRVRLYARRVSVAPPRIAFGPTDSGGRADYDHTHDVVTFDLAKHLCRHDADDSAAHEVAHKRWPALEHRSPFYRRVAAMRDGARVGPRGSRLPPSLR